MPERTKTAKTGIIFIIILLRLLILDNAECLAQEAGEEQDTIVRSSDLSPIQGLPEQRSPRKAALYSASLPGLGQIYNQKYWKLPIVYAGFGTLVYFIDRNQRYYMDFKMALLDEDYQLKYYEFELTDEQLRRGLDVYKRWRDLSIIGVAGFYALQILDAMVDAYLFDWDVGEDISLHMEPSPGVNSSFPSNSFGLRACISF